MNEKPNDSIRLDRVPPQNVDAERAVLGAMLQGGTQLVGEVLQYAGEDLIDMFYKMTHQYICGAILRLFDKNEKIDIVTVTMELEREGELERAASRDGDAVVYMDEMIDATIPVNVLSHVDILKEFYTRRTLIRMGVDIYNRSFDYGEDTKDLLKYANERVSNVNALTSATAWKVKTVAMSQEEYEWFITHLAEYSIRTGFDGLDKLIRFAPPDIWTIIGHNGVGKSILAQNIAQYAWELNRIKSLYVSYEMACYSLYERMASMASIKHPRDIEGIYRDGSLSKDDITRLVMAKYGQGIFFMDRSDINLLQIGQVLRSLPEIRLVILDYIQIMPSTSRSDNKHEKITAITDRLKEFNKENNVATIMLSQVHKGVRDQFEELRPSDARESGSITEVADGVVGFWADKDIESLRNVGILKSRHFSMAVGKKVQLAFQGDSPLLKGIMQSITPA